MIPATTAVFFKPVVAKAAYLELPFQNPSLWAIVTDRFQTRVDSYSTLKSLLSIRNQFDENSLHGLSFYFNQLKSWLFELLPFLQSLVLQLPELFPSPIPILIENLSQNVTLSKHQCAALIATSFFCLFDHPRSRHGPNFDSFFSVTAPCQLAKYKCILEYFDRLKNEGIPDRYITIHRAVMTKEKFILCAASPDRCINDDELVTCSLSNDNTLLNPVTILPEGKIEDAKDALFVDFANKYIGGGTLRGGCVQEEILFMIYPECLISMMICERMHANEAIIIIGAERYSLTSGYSNSFCFESSFADWTLCDNAVRRSNVIVAIDSIQANLQPQFTPYALNRQIIKAFTGFSIEQSILSDHTYPYISTGNWGCGAFACYHQLIAMIQWIAAAKAHREMLYYTFGTSKLKGFSQLIELSLSRSVTISELYKALLSFFTKTRNEFLIGDISLFSYLMECFGTEEFKNRNIFCPLPMKEDEKEENT